MHKHVTNDNEAQTHSFQSSIFNFLFFGNEVSRYQPSRGWLAVVERGKITQSFRRERVCKFAGKKRRFYNSGKTGNL